MTKIQIIIKSLRLYSLMVSTAGIITGTFLAAATAPLNKGLLVFTLLTTWCLHLLCNVSNDYGDAVRGTDSKDDFGDIRYVQDGLLSLRETKNIVLALGILSVIFGSLMILTAFGWGKITIQHVLFVVFGILAILGAVLYTNGKKPYGYISLGDLSVFLFFGIATVMGSFYLQTGIVDATLFLPASSVGLLIVGLLNNNNIRDIATDFQFNKITVAYRMGLKTAKIYQIGLFVAAVVAMLIFSVIKGYSARQYLYLIGLIPMILYVRAFLKCQMPIDYHKLMGPISMLVLIWGILIGVAAMLA